MHRFGQVVMLGPTNAGKSTLLNRFVGQKVSIVTPKPQTTRNRVSGIVTLPEAQVVFLDTPGLHQHKGGIAPLLLRTAVSALAGADAVLLVLDAARYAERPGAMDKELTQLVRSLKDPAVPLLAALNKIDAVREKARLLPVMERVAEAVPKAVLYPVSATRGEGTEALLSAVVELLPEGPPLYDQDEVSTAPVRFMAAEIVREKLFMALGEELPYSLAVDVEDWDESTTPGLTRIQAVIYVAREGHKGMVIGKGGAVLKRVGSEARAEIMDMLERKVHLELWVKVRQGWTGDKGFARSLGLGE